MAYVAPGTASIAIIELQNLYPITNITRMIKSRKMRSSWNIECMGKECIEGFGKKIRIKERIKNTYS
jgi:hypothetical protein